MNNYTVSGNLTKDMEIKPTKNGKQMLKYSIGVQVGWGDQKKTLWVNCLQYFGFSENYLGKQGDFIELKGELDFFPDKENEKKQVLYVKAINFSIIKKKEVAADKVKDTFKGNEVDKAPEQTNESPFDDESCPF